MASLQPLPKMTVKPLANKTHTSALLDEQVVALLESRHREMEDGMRAVEQQKERRDKAAVLKSDTGTAAKGSEL